MPSSRNPVYRPSGPKPGCVLTFLILIFLLAIVTWWWAFQPPMPEDGNLQEITGTLESWEEHEVKMSGGRLRWKEHELELRLTGQPLPFLVERIGYDDGFRREAFTAQARKGTPVRLLVEKADLSGKNKVRTRAASGAAGAWFTLDDYRQGVAARHRWGLIVATLVTGFAGFCTWRIRRRWHTISGLGTAVRR